MRVLFWRDMVLVGTLVNLLFTGVALAMAASDLPIGLAAAVHFAPLPFNLFLVFAVWRQPASVVHRWVAVGWLGFVTLV
ncbi:putative membrane protein [Hydrogenophaga sp. RAC07]|nr:putative membrane protein [Hydrogenophaga sp. RAC07]